MNNKRKKYVGSFPKEKDAAVLYDKASILTYGMKVMNLKLIFLGKDEFRLYQVVAPRDLKGEHPFGLTSIYILLNILFVLLLILPFPTPIFS